MKDYRQFLEKKEFGLTPYGFEPLWLPTFLKGFQHHLDDWAIRLGRGAIYADCGLGKTPVQLVFAENCVRKANGNALVLAPLAVSSQTVREGEKFEVRVTKTQDGRVHRGVNVTNYERLARYSPVDFCCVVADESSVLKHCDGKTRKAVTEFMSRVPYRLLCTATPSPNDHMELGSSSEALGVMTRNQMLGTFFTNGGKEGTQQWDLKGHARTRFWRWVASWARAVRKPSDLGYDDAEFILPPLHVETHPIPGEMDGFFPKMAVGLDAQRLEKKRTVKERCEKVASVLPPRGYAVVWCHLNAEGDLLTRLIPGAVQVAGSDREEVKEERLEAFAKGQIRVLVTKPKIASFGLNWQHCNVMTFFPHHSHEQYYQAVRRCWRFGQKKPVTAHMILTEAEQLVLDNMLRKEKQAVELYEGIVREMNSVLKKHEENGFHERVKLPGWLRGK